jgi:hypothetical protein
MHHIYAPLAFRFLCITLGDEERVNALYSAGFDLRLRAHRSRSKLRAQTQNTDVDDTEISRFLVNMS